MGLLLLLVVVVGGGCCWFWGFLKLFSSIPMHSRKIAGNAMPLDSQLSAELYHVFSRTGEDYLTSEAL